MQFLTHTETEPREFYCESRVQENYLLSDKRKVWIENRLASLASIFLVEVASYSISEKLFQITLHNRPDKMATLSDKEIISRWWKLFPAKIKGIHIEEPPPELMNIWIKDKSRSLELRKRLSDVSWYMKTISEPLEKLAQKEEQNNSPFWQAISVNLMPQFHF